MDIQCSSPFLPSPCLWALSVDASPTFPPSWAPVMEYNFKAGQGIDPGKQEGMRTGGDGTEDYADAT